MDLYRVKLPVAYWMSIPFEISMHGETLWVGRHTSKFDLENGAATISQLCKKLSAVIFPDRIEDITSEALRVITWFDNSEHAPILVHPNIEVTRCTRLGAEGKFVSMYAMMRDISVNLMMIVKISLNEGGVLMGADVARPLEKGTNINFSLEMTSEEAAKKAWKDLKSYGLKNLAEYHQIKFNHHRADADAEVCAKISLLSFERLMVTNNEDVNSVFGKRFKIL